MPCQRYAYTSVIKKAIMSYVFTILATLVACYLCLMLFALLFANRMIFPAPPVTYHKASLPLISLPLPQGGEVYAVHLPNDQARHTLLYCHGNAEDLGTIYPLLQAFQQRGFAVFAVDYPGYGLSKGKPSEEGCIAASNAAYLYLKTFFALKPEQIILYGRSLGGGPAINLASREQVAGLILDGTFTSTFRVITQRKILFWDIFDNLAHIRNVQSPLLVIHGEQDVTVPFTHGVKLYTTATTDIKQHLWVKEAGHNNLIDIAGDTYWQAIAAFCAKL